MQTTNETTASSPRHDPVLSEATARPWIACFSTLNGTHVGFHIAGKPYGSTRPICDAKLSDQYAPEMAANAALIVKAVNHFEALVAALEESRVQIEYLDDKFTRTGTSAATLTRIRAALAGAK